MKLSVIFGKNIKYHRYLKGYSQEHLAELLNSSTSYVSRLECGKINTTFDSISKIADILSIKPNELFIERDFNNMPTRISDLK